MNIETHPTSTEISAKQLGRVLGLIEDPESFKGALQQMGERRLPLNEMLVVFDEAFKAATDQSLTQARLGVEKAKALFQLHESDAYSIRQSGYWKQREAMGALGYWQVREAVLEGKSAVGVLMAASRKPAGLSLQLGEEFAQGAAEAGRQNQLMPILTKCLLELMYAKAFFLNNLWDMIVNKHQPEIVIPLADRERSAANSEKFPRLLAQYAKNKNLEANHA